MIKENIYFDGKIKSLGFDIRGTVLTAGVIEPGEYSLTTEKEEHITVTAGDIEVRLSDGTRKSCKTGETVVVPAKMAFGLKSKDGASYTCIYK